MTARTLRSKKERSRLWLAADGKCQLCGEPLGEDWQADHIVPWSVSHQTNVHEMQALCTNCNRRKGSLHLRKHQQEFSDLCKNIAGGAIPMPKFIAAHVVCGGGKSTLPVIAAYWLIEQSARFQKICWVTPNGTLRRQAGEAFQASDLSNTFFNHHLSIYESGNELNPSKGTAGYAMNYQAVTADTRIHQQEFARFRYILVLDEPHHIQVGSSYERAIRPLVQRAGLVILMTGTLDRANQKPVAFFSYTGQGMVNTASSPDFQWVRYGFRDAFNERAIIRTEFRLIDAATEYVDTNGQRQRHERLEDSPERVFVALQTEAAAHILRQGIESWQGIRVLNRGAKCLIVCANVKQAERVLALLRSMGLSGESAIATHKQEDEADKEIERFKTTSTLNILVTVAKAYEGLDVPAITHTIALTHIRSLPWILQMVARGWRFDPKAGEWSQQRHYCFAPNDEGFRRCIADIDAEQQRAVRLMSAEGDDVAGGTGGGGGATDWKVVVPIRSTATDQNVIGLGGDAAATADAGDTALLLRAMEESGVVGVGVLDFKNAMDAYHRMKAQPVSNGTAWDTMSAANGTTPKKTIDELRQLIFGKVRRAAAGSAEGNREINIELKTMFGPREAMDEATCRAAIAYLAETYDV